MTWDGYVSKCVQPCPRHIMPSNPHANDTPQIHPVDQMRLSIGQADPCANGHTIARHP